jgi:hypothetical protein
MEDRNMKKEYMQPAMLVVDMNVNVQMLAGSVTSVVTTGLGDDITPDPEPTTDPWDDAMTREFEVEDEWD